MMGTWISATSHVWTFGQSHNIAMNFQSGMVKSLEIVTWDLVWIGCGGVYLSVFVDIFRLVWFTGF